MLDQFKDLLAERTRVGLTIFAIAWGTLSISLMLAVGENFRHSFSQKMQEVGQGLLIVAPGVSAKAYHGLPPQGVKFTQQDVQAIASLPGINRLTTELSGAD